MAETDDAAYQAWLQQGYALPEEASLYSKEAGVEVKRR